MSGLHAYLDRHRRSGAATPSHTSIGPSAHGGPGAFDVPQPDYHEFLDLYVRALDLGERPSLTEQPCLFFPFVADVDLAYDVPGAEPGVPDDTLQRVHGEDFVREVAVAFAKSAVHLCATSHEPHSIQVYVMQRRCPYVKSSGLVRDGLHMLLPGVILPRPAQALLRRGSLGAIQEALARLSGQNLDVNDSVDSCYSERGTNWQMYGSSKPGREPYLVTHSIRAVIHENECISLTSAPIDDPSDWGRWVPIMSVRNSSPDRAWVLGPVAAEQVDAIEEEWSERRFAQLRERDGFHICSEPSSSQKTDCRAADVETARQLVRCMNPARSDTYTTWRDVGFALRNTATELVDAWHEFSAKSAKYDRRVCQMFWDRLRPEERTGAKLGMGSLIMWARQDDPTALEKVERSGVEHILAAAISGNTHTDWGRYVCALQPGKLASVRASGTGRGDRTLYVFENHRWRPEPCGTFVKMLLKTKVVEDVTDYLQRHADDADLAKKGAKAIANLKSKGFRESVLGDITESVGDDRLLDKLDSKRNLIGWNNGVFDLDAQDFRDGQPEDYVSMSTGHDYAPPDSPQYERTAREIETFMEKVHVSPVLREYCLDSLAVMLSGVISFEHMHCWTGTGSNGKSRMVKLLDEGLGDYLKTLAPSLLTGGRPESGKPTPELCSASGARIVVMSEVDGKATINVAVMKELSGGDKIAVRALYGAASTLRPQFSMIMTCNDLSKVDSNDDGTWRRLKVLPWRSKFVLNNPQGELEFIADNSMDGRLQDWAPYFISMLQSRYHHALASMRQEPEEITNEVRLYRVASDRDADFVAKNLVPHGAPSSDDEQREDADAWALLDIYKRDGRDRDITLTKLSDKLERFGIPRPVKDPASGAATIPGYHLALRVRA